LIRTLAVFPALSLALSAFLSAPPLAAAEKRQLDADPALFTVMTAINAAGFDADVDSAANHPARQKVRDYLKSRNIPSLAELRQFVELHKQGNPYAEFNQYISYALSIYGPPDFEFRYSETELAPDVLPLTGLSPILARFYKEAALDQVWEKLQPAYDEMITAYQGPVTRSIMVSNAYLRNPTSGYMGRRFQIYVDLLGPPNQVQTRSYKDDYFIVVTPSPELQNDEIRHAYLHYLLDPLVLKYSEALSRARGLLDYAQAAPALEEYYKTDFTLFSTECLIKAVEARLAPAAKRDDLVTQALREGFVMTPAFSDGLAAYEKQDQALRLYFLDLVMAMDLRKEEKRLANVDFVERRAVKTVRVVPAEKPARLTGPQKALEDANKLYAERKLDQARDAFTRLLQTTDDHAIHARAYYGLARIAVLQSNPELGVKLFQRVLELDPDAEVRAWSLVYLGRLYDSQSDGRDEALKNYRAALEVQDAPESARQAAQKGLKESFSGRK
jgi:tetratricopeptide (TPR) repeat protein